MSEEVIMSDQDDINVMPTKSLFVDMLTRDIPIDRAVIDLIDNSVDGARRLRPGAAGSLDGLTVTVDLDATKFEISDNCGGISIEHAKKYAFRFGRPKGMQSNPGSVGQFGVGMKRALFKFGKAFKVFSKTTDEKFEVVVDVDEWKDEGSPWTFQFRTAESGLANPIDETGTTIIVSRLLDNVSSAFGDQRFRISLSRQIEAAQQQYINQGLRIVFDGKTLVTRPWNLFNGAGIAPAYVEDKLVIDDEHEPIYVRIFAGVDRSDPKSSGWYVFCNGRMLLESDQTNATGWSDLAETADIAIPRFHNQFARFRGYVFFDCKDTSLLPWNTTKTGVDEDNAIYKAIRLKMMQLARPIIDFLNDADAEKENDPKDRPLESALSAAVSSSLSQISLNSRFTRPASVRAPVTVSIQYRRDSGQVEALKESFGVGSARAAGERSFDYALAKLTEED